MNLKHLDLVAWSLARIKAVRHSPARVFLSRLAQLDPRLPRLFGNVGGDERRTLARVHLLAAAGFRSGKAHAALRAIAERCRQLKVGRRDQAVILAAALWTLRHVLGAGFTAADREAWIAYQEQLLSLLRSAARADAAQTA